MKTESELIAYKNIESDFSDYTFFEVDPTCRSVERDAFINNLKYTPDYKYPELDRLIYKRHKKEKRAIYESVMELDASKNHSNADGAETELFAHSLEVRLKRIMLVEAARNLEDNNISLSTMDVNRESFSKLNESLYGKFDTSCYLGMVATEKNRLATFIPKSVVADGIKSKLELLLGRVDVDGKQEETLLDATEMKKLHDFVSIRYADVLSVVPNTPNDVYYNVTQCVEIMNKALEAGGLTQYGWKTIENPVKSNPSTTGDKSTINLPGNTRRTASDLRRLIIHEQEVHARRAQNGKDSGLKPLGTGIANFVDVEEGLGVLLECAVDGNFDNPSFDRARNRYITAGLALGADRRPRDAREVYEALWRIITIQDVGGSGDVSDDIVKKAKDKAYAHVENAYRGTQFWMKGVIYTKLKVYYEGLAKNAEYFKRNIDTLDIAFGDAFIGKYNHTDPVESNLVKSIIVHNTALTNM